MTEATWVERRFARLLALAAAIGAAVRLGATFSDHRAVIGGDGIDYHASAIRLANGLGYTSAFGDVGRQTAQHPPGWVTLLAGAVKLGFRSQRDFQLVGAAIGILLVVVVGLVGRRYVNARVGVIAAVIAAVYPGFWLLERNMLSEPLGLLVLGVLLLAIADLGDRPTLARSAGVGAICGLLALVRSEEILLVAIVVAPILLSARSLALRRRITLLAVAAVVCGVVIAPWTVYNSTRFKDPVLLSTNDGALVLLGNCPPAGFRGPLVGYFEESCLFRLARTHPSYDRSQLDTAARRQGLHNEIANAGRLPIVVPARFGRLLALYNPSQTVHLVAAWMTTGTAPIWAWVASYWLLLLLAIGGLVLARRARVRLLPLLGPVLIVVVSVAVSYGEPRYHTPSDLAVVVLAAVAIDRVLFRRWQRGD